MANVCGLALDPKAAVTQLIEICKASLCPPSSVHGYLFWMCSDQASAAAAKPREKNRGPIDLRKKRSRCSFKKTYKTHAFWFASV